MDPQATANVVPKPPPPPKPLSCTNCRARKLKCSREHPCSHCVRSGAECVFPTRKRIRKPRKSKNSDLLQRLSRLESIVGNVSLSGLAGDDVATSALSPSTGPGTACPVVERGSNQTQPAGSERQDWPEALQASKASRYLSGEFWSSLCGEVEGLRQALEQSTDSDDEEKQPQQEATPESPYDNSSTTSGLSPGMLLGNSSRGSYESFEHPSSDYIRFLTSTFFENVDMTVKILHRPTVEAALLALADAPESARPQLAPETEALFFSIYHAAVVSILPSTCLVHLGRRREDLMRSYAARVEHFLGRADYLNNTSLETLQALALYVACVRTTSGSRAAWALLSLPIRLAQGLDLHRESSNAHLSPYETELRRRLWWQLVVLDIRASEDRGTTTVIARDSYDTRLPLNVNDADFGPDTPGPLAERQGPTDVTFSLCTAQCSNLFLHVEHAHGALGISANAGAAPSGPSSHTVEETVRHAQALESQFVAGADPAHAPSYLASVTVRLVILKLWLIMQYPVHPRRRRPCPPQPPPKPSVVPHEATLRTAVSIMELNEYLRTGPYGDRFQWWANTYVQWHPLAVALAELCAQTRGELADRAWRTVDDVFPRWGEVIADAKSGTLWRPIRKLYKKAKAARSTATAAPTATTSASTTAASPPTSDTTTTTRVTTIFLKGDKVDHGTINVQTKNPVTITTTRPPAGGEDNTTMAEPEPESVFGVDIRNAREPSVPPDLNALSMSPFAFNESMLGWRDLGFEVPFLDIGGSSNMMDWSTWDDFVNDTRADADGQSKSGSSDMGY
ncbi:fungal-specific transcription factor domain-containing protein [Jackrogersella minutella]|nr:fungal-specific transcription factor domain-containing protein [Jackrogersella minutella]